MTAPSVFFGPMRIPFLLLTPVCVGLGAAVVLHLEGTLRLDWLLLALVGGLCGHISVNALNEYSDFRSGLDLRTTRTPFSGGSGALPANPEKAHWAAAIGAATLGVTLLVGFYFLWVRGVGLLLVGIPGILAVVLYTPWLTRHPLFCLLAPGIGFGPCMVMGTAFVLTGTYSAAAAVACLPPFFLVSNLLLINQFPDIAPDREVGRRHLMIAHGRNAGVIIYKVFLAATYLSILIAWLAGWLPAAALIALLTAPLAVHTAAGLAKHHDDTRVDALLPYLGKNVIITLVTPTLLAIGLLAGRT